MLDYKIFKLTIGRSCAAAYAFLADPRNFSVWGGADPGTGVTAVGGNDWRVHVNGMTLVLRCTPPNPYGILDCQPFVEGTEPGRATPLRVTPNLDGCDLVFTSFRQPEVTPEQFASDAIWLESDLLRIKTFLETDFPTPRLLASTVISLGIERPVEKVYPFLAEPRQFMKWAAITGNRLTRVGDNDWLADTAVGPRIMRFSVAEEFGVADQAMFAEGETPLTNPTRVVPNGDGTLLTYVCFQRPGMSDEKYASTIEWITSDLMVLKSLAEI